MVYFVGAGPGAPDLITVRGQSYLSQADVVIYAGSLVNPRLLEETKKGCQIHNSAVMTLEEVIQVKEDNRQASHRRSVSLRRGEGADGYAGPEAHPL